MTAIEKAFAAEGYTPIPFVLNGAGLPMVDFTYKEHEIKFLLDTGAGANLLDKQFAEDLGLALAETGGKGGGAGGMTHDVYSIDAIEFQYNELLFPFEQFLAMDFNTIKESLESQGITHDFQGILGVDFFKRTNSLIDYGNKRIYVKPG